MHVHLPIREVHYLTNKLQRKIERRINVLPAVPHYLYSTDSVFDEISTVWLDITSSITGTSDLRERYDELYQAAMEYRRLTYLKLSNG